MINQKKFTERIKALREEKGWTQLQLAEKLEITRGAVGHLENGKNSPSVDILDRMADVDVFDTTTDYLIGKTDIRSKSTSDELAKGNYILDRLRKEGLLKNDESDKQVIDDIIEDIKKLHKIKKELE